jgi:hypothetical protein
MTGEQMTLEEAQIAWLQADTRYKVYLATRGERLEQRVEELEYAEKQEQELEVVIPKLKPRPSKIEDMPW